MSQVDLISKRKRKAQDSWNKSKKSKITKEDSNEGGLPIDPISGEAIKTKKHVKKVNVASAMDDKPEMVLDSKPQKSVPTTEGAQKNKRFTLFLGNLSFKTSIEDIQAHIKPTGVTPLSVRMQTDPKTSKPKGFAFVDLENFMALDKVLNLHHSSLGGRKINVELTAGGGGKGEARKAKIQKKNEKLDVERETSQKTKREAEAKKARTRGANGPSAEDKQKKAEEMADVNPARRKRIA